MTKLPVVHRGGVAPAKLSPLQLYLQEIARYPLLEPEEELELAKAHFEQGDVSAAHRLVTANLRLVVKIANDFSKAQSNLLDLIQEGNYGLMQAVKRFNPYKGVKLSTYAAWWIRAYILKYLMDNRSQVKIATTAAQRKLYYNLEKTARQLLTEYDTVDSKLLADKLQVKEREVEEMRQRLSAPDTSLDAPINDEPGSSVTRADQLVMDEEPYDEVMANRQIREVFAGHLEDFRSTLKDRDLDVFNARLLAENPVTLQEIGDRYGISRERARQIENRIIEKLRKFVDSQGIIDAEVIKSQ